MFNKAIHTGWVRTVIMLFGAALAALTVNIFIVPQGLYNGGLLGFVQPGEVFHVRKVVFHLLQTAHPAEYRQDIIQSGSKAQRPACARSAAVRFLQNQCSSIH